MKIKVIGYTPASINTYTEIIEGLKKQGYFVDTLLLHIYGEALWNKPSINIENVSEKDIRTLLYSELEGFDLVMYSLESGKADRLIPEICDDLGIYSLGNVFTFWDSSYAELKHRFGGKQKPDFITVTTEDIKAIFEENITESKVFCWGNPFTDRLSDLKLDLDKLPEKRGVLHFFSQPNGTGGFEDTNTQAKYMVEEFEALIAEGYIDSMEVYIHPRENPEWFISKGYTPRRIENFLEAISSEYIASASSTVMYEAVLLNKKSLKYTEDIKIKFKNKDFIKFNLELGGSLDKWLKGISDLHDLLEK